VEDCSHNSTDRSKNVGIHQPEAGDTLGSFIEECLALALWGRQEEALRLLAELPSPAGAGQLHAAEPGCTCRPRLWRARALLVRGDPQSLTEAQGILEELGTSGCGVAWKSWLERARVEKRSGSVPQAATLLGRAVQEFRSQADDGAGSPGPLGRLLSAEVEFLQRPDPVGDCLSDANAAPSGTHESDASQSLRNPARSGSGLEVPAGSHDARDERHGLHGGDGEHLDAESLLRLVELGKRLATESEPDEVLRIVLHEAIDLSRAERGFIVLTREDDFEFALAENLDWSEVNRPSFEISRTLVRRAMEERSSVVMSLSDASNADPARRSLAEIGVRSVACVPILHASAILGVLYLDGRDPRHSFRGRGGRLLELFAAQAGAALINARIHRERLRAIEKAEETIQRHRSESERRMRYAQIVGASEPMQEVYRKLDRIIPTEMPVLVLGETGTGKELVAQLIHTGGPRKRKEFVAMNCAGLAESILEAELFGHERGAFTGAERARPGLFEVADGGTLFLDEVGDMSPRMQSDLLRVLQSGEMRRVGGRESIHVDVRIIAATHRNLEKLVQRGTFRQDLYFRLNVLSLSLPALREKAEDIPLLIGELLRRLVPEEKTPPTLSDRAMHRLVAYPWPGNVRELENVLRRLIVLDEERIEERHLPDEIRLARGRAGRAGTLRRAEEEAIRNALDATSGNKAEAARILGVDRTTLYAKLRRHSLED
jgi:transcriptional regulator with GAF, ATPase, and Fis domain